MQTLFQTPVSTPRRNFDIRGLLNRVRFGPRGAKFAVILVFTVCWFFVAAMRSNAVRDPLSLESSTLVGLAASMQHSTFSGRDFQSLFGPGTQTLAWTATLFTKPQAPVESLGRITFVFCAFSALLIATMLWTADRFSWQECVIVSTFCFLLNLFFAPLAFMTAVLLLSVVIANQVVAAQRMRRQILWATAAALLCFEAQLLTFELGIYVFLATVVTLIGGSILTRNRRALVGIEVFVATLAVANIALAVLFKWTSSNYELLFDYQNYSLEILRGFHDGMGGLWQLPLPHTIVLVLTSLYIIAACILVGLKSDPLDASLLGGFTFAALIWLKTAAIQSDIPHITAAFSPMLLVLALLAMRVWKIKPIGQIWAAVVILLLIVWPEFNFSAPEEIFKFLNGKTVSTAAASDGGEPARKAGPSLIPGLMTSSLSERNRVSSVTYSEDRQGEPSNSYRFFFPPVLETYSASTHSLERYYMDSLDRRRGEGLDIALADIHAITHTPGIFEYLYRHFGLVGNEDHAEGPYALHERYEPRDAPLQTLAFTTPQQLPDQGMLKLTAPTTCGIVRLEMRIEYEKDTRIFRPAGVELSLLNSGQLAWKRLGYASFA